MDCEDEIERMQGEIIDLEKQLDEANNKIREHEEFANKLMGVIDDIAYRAKEALVGRL